MIITVLIGLYHINKKPCKVMHVCGRTYLVVYHTHGIMLLCNIKHGTYEIISVDRESPGYPHNKEVVDTALHCLFSGKLCRPVYGQRMKTFVIRIPGLISASAKYIVCTYIEQFAACFLAGCRNISGTVFVNLKHHFPVLRVFSRVNGSPARRMDDGIGI